VDGLMQRRLDRPYVRRDGKLVEASWGEAFAAIAERFGTLPGGKIAARAGDLVDVEAMLARKGLMTALGSATLDCRPDGARILAAARRLAESCNMLRPDWNAFNVLHCAAARVGGLDIGFVPGPGGRDRDAILAGCESGEIEAVYLLGADEIAMARLGRAIVVYQGHHGDAGARRADVVLPGAAYPEKDGIYVNTEGRVQAARRAVFPPGDAREDWAILRALSDRLGRKLPYDSL